MNGTISLRAARVDAELSQAAAAKRVGVSERTISKWEAGITHPTAVQLVALCNLYGRSLDDIRLPKISD